MKSTSRILPLVINGRPVSGPLETALWAMGFRPFFLMAGVSAVALIVAWAVIYAEGYAAAPMGQYLDVLSWHFHEMLFGFTLAVVAGFLLTATSNWTAQRTIHGTPLAALVALWLAGRIAMLCGTELPGWLIATIDLSFTPALAVALLIPLLRTRNYHNMIFTILLAVLTAANLLIHLQALGAAATARLGAYIAVYIIVIMIVMVGGRVFPYFASKRLDSHHVRKYPAIEAASVISIAVLAVADLAFPSWTYTLAAVAATACVIHAVRFVG